MCAVHSSCKTGEKGVDDGLGVGKGMNYGGDGRARIAGLTGVAIVWAGRLGGGR